MSKLRLRAIFCTVGVFILSATALVAFRPYALSAGEDEAVVKKRWSILSPFTRTKMADKKKSRNGVQLVSSEKVVIRQQSRTTPSTRPNLRNATYDPRTASRQPRRTSRPVRRVKKSFLTKTKEFFTSKVPGFRKKQTQPSRYSSFELSNQKQTKPRQSKVRFASSTNKKAIASKQLGAQTSKTQKSEVLEHLKKLYERDGLPMPEMDMKKMGQESTKDEDPMLNNPFAKIASEMSQKNAKANHKGDAKPIYAGPLNDPTKKSATENPFASFDKKTIAKKSENPFETTKEAETKPAIKLVQQKRDSPLKKHMSSPKKITRANSEKETPIGFQGYCPVSLKDSRKKTDVNPKLVTVYEGTLYSFSSEQAREKFLANPVRYAPVMGGSDMVQMIEHGQTVEGSLEHCCWFRGRLYMFVSKASLQTFLNHPSQFATDVSK